MSAIAENAERRAGLYERLAARNRVVGVLRIAVPILGVLLLAALVGQIVLSNLAQQYGVGSIALDRSRITVDAPRYSGVMSDGTVYRVTGSGAEADIDNLDVITLTGAVLVMDNPDGTRTTAEAASADLQTVDEQVTVGGQMSLDMSRGTQGTLSETFIDMPSRHLVASGPVHFTFANDSTLDAKGLDYDAAEAVYIFTDVTLDQPYVPPGGAAADEE